MSSNNTRTIETAINIDAAIEHYLRNFGFLKTDEEFVKVKCGIIGEGNIMPVAYTFRRDAEVKSTRYNGVEE